MPYKFLNFWRAELNKILAFVSWHKIVYFNTLLGAHLILYKFEVIPMCFKKL